MKRTWTVCLLALILLCGAYAAAETAGPEIPAEDVTDFYYTYNWVGYNAEYQRYRFYAEDGKHFFFHESRGTEGDYGWNTEEDILSSGTKELSAAEWAAFGSFLEGGATAARNEEPVDGDSGPWMFLYLNGDESGLEFRFASAEVQAEFIRFCEELAEGPLQASGLVSCEYRVFGGMENEDTSLKVARAGEAGREVRLTVRENGKTKEIVLPRNTLEELADFLAGHHPERWESLPDAEFFALDAPDRRIELVCGDGTEYSVGSGKETEGPLFWELSCFLRSYLAEDAETFELSFESFYGGGPEYIPVLSAPEVVRVEEFTVSENSEEPVPPGSGYTVRMVFHGRVPGETELTIEGTSPLVPVGEAAPPTVYVLNVDDDYNVTLVE